MHTHALAPSAPNAPNTAARNLLRSQSVGRRAQLSNLEPHFRQDVLQSRVGVCGDVVSAIPNPNPNCDRDPDSDPDPYPDPGPDLCLDELRFRLSHLLCFLLKRPVGVCVCSGVRVCTCMRMMRTCMHMVCVYACVRPHAQGTLRGSQVDDVKEASRDQPSNTSTPAQAVPSPKRQADRQASRQVSG